MTTQESLKPLKLLVISLGVILIGGMVFLCTALWKEVAGYTPPAPVTACSGGKADLSGRGIIVESRMEGGNLRLMLERAPGRNEMLVIDSCTGAITSSLVITTDSGIERE